LPTYGYYLSGLYTGPTYRPSEFMHVGRRGYFWSSTARPDRNLNAYNLYVARGGVHTGYGDRQNAHCQWPE
jgi:lipoprotein